MMKIRVAGSVMIVEQRMKGIRIVPHAAQHYEIVCNKKMLLDAIRNPSPQPLKISTRGYGEIVLIPLEVGLHPVEGDSYWKALRLSLGGNNEAVFLLGDVDVQALEYVLSKRRRSKDVRLNPADINEVLKNGKLSVK